MNSDPAGWQLTILLCVCVICYTTYKCFQSYNIKNR